MKLMHLLPLLFVAALLVSCGAQENTVDNAAQDTSDIAELDGLDAELQELDDLDSELNLDSDLEELDFAVE